jgi:amino acid transporter
MIGSTPANAIWVTVTIVGMFLLGLTGYLGNRDHDRGRAFQILTVVVIVMAVLSVLSCVATLVVLRSDRRRWPSIDRVRVPRILKVSSLGAGALATIAAGAWLFLHNFVLALTVEVVGLVMSWLWRKYDRAQEAHLLLQLAAIDASARPPDQSPITWS